MKYTLVFTLLLMATEVGAQSPFPADPEKAEFVTSDIPLFWECFDARTEISKPYRRYLQEGSPGVQGFIKYRIENHRNLQRTVEDNEERYTSVREQSFQIAEYGLGI
ncbi:MAG: hypothetical protein AAFQ98_25955 [Bacteroidota bacterium]